MSESVKVDMVTFDPKHDEYVLYLVIDGPWPIDTADWSNCLRKIQIRTLAAINAAVDGGVEKQFPDSLGKGFRIQIDCPHGCPEPVTDLVSRINTYIATTAEYANAIQTSKFVRAVRVVTGHEMGRFTSRVIRNPSEAGDVRFPGNS